MPSLLIRLRNRLWQAPLRGPFVGGNEKTTMQRHLFRSTKGVGKVIIVHYQGLLNDFLMSLNDRHFSLYRSLKVLMQGASFARCEVHSQKFEFRKKQLLHLLRKSRQGVVMVFSESFFTKKPVNNSTHWNDWGSIIKKSRTFQALSSLTCERISLKAVRKCRRACLERVKGLTQMITCDDELITANLEHGSLVRHIHMTRHHDSISDTTMRPDRCSDEQEALQTPID